MGEATRSRLFGDGRSGYARVADDWYVEQEWAVARLFDVERFAGALHDPACGKGTIPLMARAYGYRATGSDLVDLRKRGSAGIPGLTGGVDFLARGGRRVDNIVSNPPYRLDTAFALKALQLARRKVALLLRLAFLEGAERFETLFASFPPARAWVFRNRVSMPPGGMGIKPEGGKMPFQWLVWERGHRGPPVLGWV